MTESSPPESAGATPAVPPPPPPPPPAPVDVTTQPGTPAVPSPAAPDGTLGPDGLVWRRFHPITPAIKGWKVLLVLVAVLGQQAMDNVGAAQDVATRVGAGPIFLVLLGVLAVATGYAAVAWRMARFAVGPDAVYLRTGVLFRTARTARLDRIQAIDTVQPLLARLTGLAELKIEVAGGTDSAVKLAFLRESAARTLRAELLARAAGLAVPTPAPAAPTVPGAVPPGPPGPGAFAPGAPAEGALPLAVPPGHVAATGVPALIPEAPERQVFAVSLGTLLGSLLRSVAVGFSVLLLVALLVLVVVTREPGVIFGMFPAVLAAGSFLWGRFAGEFGFRASLSPDGIRLRHGLLEARAQTVPPGRVQAVSIVQGPLWRGKDWWRVQMNVAGYGITTDQNRQTESVLLPVGTRDEALLALWLVLPDLGAQDPKAVLDAALSGSGDAYGFVTSPRRARWLDPWTWRRAGVARTDHAVLVRSGRFVRRLVVVPHEKTQSLGLQQGPLQRRMGLASFTLHSTPGPVVPSVPHLDAHVAGELLLDQATRARSARARSVPERWMAAAGDPA